MKLFNAQLDNALETSLILLRRIPPSELIGNSKIIGFLIGQKNSNVNNDTSVFSTIVSQSHYGTIIANKNGIIEFINNAVTQILNYGPEQLLGQSFISILTNQCRNEIERKLQLMSLKQISQIFEGHVECNDSNDNIIPINIMIQAMFDENNGEIESFIIFFEDESEIIKKQIEIESSKKKTDDLVFQILPKSIVLRMNQGEKNISFTVPSASIMFVDIAKFSDLCSNLSPQNILDNLSQVFGSYEKLIEKYPLITRIKLIGDTYMCAAGIFNPDSNPASHANEIIRFGLDILQEIEDLNHVNNTNYTVRIGVNTGGPIIAGVLGEEKPVFDIIGDPINVAARLQTTGIPGRIQISQTTYDLIAQQDFFIEKRGTVNLKGKGECFTYLVSPHTFILQDSSSSARF